MSAAILINNNTFFRNKNSLAIKVDNVIDVEDCTAETRSKSIVCMVDKNNIDSMLGAALWISKIDFDKAIEIYSYHPLDSVGLTKSYDQVINFGCYIPNKMLKQYRGTLHTKIFTYRGNYEKLVNSDELEVVRPCDDWYGAEQAMVDNSIAFNVTRLMAMKEKPSDLYSLKSLARDLALYINFAHKGIKTIENQVKIHNMRIALERAFSKSNIRDAVREISVNEDPDGYRLRLDQVRQISKTHGRDKIFTIPGKGWNGSPRQFLIKTFSCPTGMSRDLMKMVLPVHGSCITYEDIRQYKLLRIVTNDKRKSLVFANLLKPFHIWEEGETVVAIVAEEK